ncbi:MAG TPA: ribosomal protein L7/L12 [Gemmataceae bacterium]|jgi:hypothetical protein
MLAALEWSDLFWIWLIVIVFAGGTAAVFRPTDAGRLRRIEAKLDLILRNLGLEFQDPAAAGLSPEVRALADDPAKKIEAIKLHREQTAAGLKEAKDAVEAYIAGRG